MQRFRLVAQVDFQVKALIGYVIRYPVPGTSGWDFIGEESDWSNTQTITVGDSSSTVTPSSSLPSSPIPTPAPSQNPSVLPVQQSSDSSVFLGLNWVESAAVSLLAAIAVLLVFVVFYLRRRSVGSAVV
jgi:hypothetical protein